MTCVFVEAKRPARWLVHSFLQGVDQFHQILMGIVRRNQIACQAAYNKSTTGFPAYRGCAESCTENLDRDNWEDGEE